MPIPPTFPPLPPTPLILPTGKKKNRKGRSSRYRHKDSASANYSLSNLNQNDNEETSDPTPSTESKLRELSMPTVSVIREKGGMQAFDSTDVKWPPPSQASSSTLSSSSSAAPSQAYLLNQTQTLLGFLPGNALSVCTYRRSKPGIPTVDDDDVNKSTTNTNTETVIPQVLKLYPLAVRSVTDGGRVGSSKRRGRRRGVIKEVDSDADADADADGDQDENDEEANTTSKTTKDNWLITFPSSPTLISDPLHSHIVEPFPTIYWLVDPALRKAISVLEDKLHGVKYMELIINECDDDKVKSEVNKRINCMENAHVQYGLTRWNLLSPSDQLECTSRNWDKTLNSFEHPPPSHPVSKPVSKKSYDKLKLYKGSGIGGITKLDTVRCLHLHVAHYLGSLCDADAGADADSNNDEERKVNWVGMWTMMWLEQEGLWPPKDEDVKV